MAGQLWGVNTLGGYMYSLELSDILRTAVQPLAKFRQFADAKDFTDKGLHKGQLFSWNVYSDVSSQGTILTETTTVPVTNFTITQGTGTVTELAQAVPFTGLLDNLSKHPVQDIINKVLKNDCKKALDGQAWNQFNQCALRVVPTAGNSATAITLTTNGTATLTNNVAMNNVHLKAIVDTMKERNIPPYAGDEYFGIAWPTTWRPLKNTLEGIYQYRDEGFQMIYNGEIGKYEGTRFIEQTNVPKGIYNGGNYISSASFTKWTNSLSDWAFFFGEDTVAEAIVVPEEMRGALPSDYGRSKGIAWLRFSPVVAQAANENIVNSGKLLAA